MYQDFIDEIYHVFDGAVKPPKDKMTPHRCCECDEIRDQLAEFDCRELPDRLLDYHGDALPLLSPEALHYYLPRYLEFSLLHQESNACDNLLYHLSPGDIDDYWAPRIDIFNADEKEIIVRYLELRRTFTDADIEKEWIERGIEVWS